MRGLLRRVQAVKAQTSPVGSSEAAKEQADPDWDEFTQLKHEIGEGVRRVRAQIKERDDYTKARSSEEAQAEVVAMGVRIGQEIRVLREKALRLRGQAEKIGKRNKGAASNEKRMKMCDLVDAHINECEAWKNATKLPNIAAARRDLLRGAQLGDQKPELIEVRAVSCATDSSLEPIDGIRDEMLQVQRNEQIIEDQLDRVSVIAAEMAALARMIEHEQQVTRLVQDEVEAKMDKTGANVETALVQVQEVKKKLDVKANCCIDIVLFLLILVMVGYLVWKYLF